MTKRMLIDATHPEETRVVVVDQDQLVDFDFESSTKTQLKGNVYLAKVTRVEPSLQAAFVEYGGNRHGFLAFSEIHPDYYQIPQADREMLERLEREAIEESRAIENAVDPSEADQPVVAAAPEEANGILSGEDASDGDDDAVVTDDDEAPNETAEAELQSSEGQEQSEIEDDDSDGSSSDEPAQKPESINEGGELETDDVLSEQVRRRARLMRSYKIQEVIKRRQILLVQVVKEERGNKGAALTTYLSLAGRYCVLMPNTPRGGGISRKITNVNDRRRLKTIIQDLDVPQGMGLIVRTAGQERNKSEIKRDYDYLLRQWSEIRETTLESVAPERIYQEGDLIKRAMRDLYARDIDEVLVEGEDSYRSGKKLMQMMMPSHARRVKLYKDDLPLFYRYHIEDQLDGMHSPTVDLPSGGSIVIHTTEALTAIDVNSGRSTRERHIDETAIKTNLEAADEVARQMRLRDLAGLVVIDFIDMAEHRHQRQVERRFRDALKLDRARLQVGRISMFGLLELSRQRLRASLLELSSQACPICSGLGVVRSTESCALHALRCVQEEGIKNEAKVLQLSVPAEVALYLLNQKREGLLRLEARYEMKVLVTMDNDLLPSQLQLDVVERRERQDGEVEEIRERPQRPERHRSRGGRGNRDHDDAVVAAETSEQPKENAQRRPTGDDENGEEEATRKRRRRRRRRRRDEDDSSVAAPRVAASETENTHSNETFPQPVDSETEPAKTESVDQVAPQTETVSQDPSQSGEDDTPRPRRRRRRRGRGDRERAVEPSVAEAEPVLADEKRSEVTPPAHGQAEELLAKLQKFIDIVPQPPRVPKIEPAVEATSASVDELQVFDEDREIDAAQSEEAVEPITSSAVDQLADDPEMSQPSDMDAALSAVEVIEEPISDPPLIEPTPAKEPIVKAPANKQPKKEMALAEGSPSNILEAPARTASDEPDSALADADEGDDPDQPERKGWWSRWVK